MLGSFAIFGVLLAAAALAPDFWSALALFTGAGCLMALNGIMANTMLQIQAPDQLRGRVMGFYSFVVLGMAPFGAFQAGWVASTSACGWRSRSAVWPAWWWPRLVGYAARGGGEMPGRAGARSRSHSRGHHASPEQSAG